MEKHNNDYTPPEYITLLFTEIGILTPSAVSDELIKLYRLKEFDNVSCIGDCAAFETSPLPQTAQVASQQGKYVAKFLNEKAKVREANKNIGEHELEG